MRIIKRPTDTQLYKTLLASTQKKYLSALAAKRGINDLSRYLLSSYEDLSSPYSFHAMSHVVEILNEVLFNTPQHLILHCDYDCDGLCSAYIFTHFIKEKFGLSVATYVNDRETEGYGLSCQVVQKLYDQGFRFIITADNGIASLEAVALAKDLGMRVIIADHHEPKKDLDHHDLLPDADAVICHKAYGNTTHSMGLCGAATIWYVCRAMDNQVAEKYIDAAGIATVVDMVSLADSDNRIMVKNALSRLNQRSFSSRTLANLFKAASSQLLLTEEDFGFSIGPLINSAGRLGHAKLLLSLLVDEDTTADAFLQLKALNDERKYLTDTFYAQALASAQLCDSKPYTTVILPEAPEGLLGLIASKLEHTTYKPTFVFTIKDGETLKGSARSRTLNLQLLFDPCSALPIQGGGHKEACGLSLRQEDFELFCAFLDLQSYPPAVCAIDGEIMADQVTEEMILQIEELSPFGVGFEKPQFLFRGDAFNDIRIAQGKHLFFRSRYASFACFNIHNRDSRIDTESLHSYCFLGKIGFNRFNGMCTPQVTVDKVLEKSTVIID